MTGTMAIVTNGIGGAPRYSTLTVDLKERDSNYDAWTV